MDSGRVIQPAEAVQRYVAQFEAFAANGAGAAPAWLRERRAAAVTRFAELGFPTTRQEDWRFTSVAPLVDTTFVPAAPGRDAGAGAGVAKAGPPRLVFVNGRFSAEHSALTSLPAGVRAGSLAAALKGDEAALMEQHLARHAPFGESAFTALNTAFLQDGAFVHLSRGAALREPLHLLFRSVPGHSPAVTHARVLLIVDEEAQATVVEHYVGDDATYWTNQVTELVAGAGARVELIRLQQEGSGAYHVASLHTNQGRDSELRIHPLVFGAALARHDITNVLDGPGAELLLNGLYLLGDRQHADHHTVIDHAQPDCRSHEYFNGVLEDRAHGVFNGRIIVRPGAQRTDSKQTNHNLVLSEDARADSQPQLEIYADDVKCTHGATLGPLDPRELFYLQSRGIAPAEARALLVYGFGAEILGRVQHAGLRDRLEEMLRERLAAGRAAEVDWFHGATL